MAAEEECKLDRFSSSSALLCSVFSLGNNKNNFNQWRGERKLDSFREIFTSSRTEPSVIRVRKEREAISRPRPSSLFFPPFALLISFILPFLIIPRERNEKMQRCQGNNLSGYCQHVYRKTFGWNRQMRREKIHKKNGTKHMRAGISTYTRRFG